MNPAAINASRFFLKTIQEVLLWYMISVGLVQPSAATLRISILISKADLLAAADVVSELRICAIFPFS